MLINTRKEKILLISMAMVLVIGTAGAAYYIHQERSESQAACTDVDKNLLEEAAGLIHTSEHKQLNSIMEQFQQTCPAYAQNADYHYIALRYHIILGDHTKARQHLNRLTSLSRENMVLDEYNQTYSNKTLESTVAFMESSARDETGDSDGVDEFTKEPGL